MSGGARTTADGATRGKVLDVLRSLLDDGRDDAVVKLFHQLVARNEELELLLAKIRESKNRSERVSRDQLDLFIDKLHEEADAELQAANDKLEKTAKNNRGRPEPEAAPKKPALRRPPPPALRRVDNPIPVPDAERPCPVCGQERTCIGHDTPK